MTTRDTATSFAGIARGAVCREAAVRQAAVVGAVVIFGEEVGACFVAVLV